MNSLLDAPPPSAGAASLVAIAGTVATYGVIAALVSYAGVRSVTPRPAATPITELVEVELPNRPPPPEAPEPKREPEPVVSPPPRLKAAAPKPARLAPEPSPAAAAGQVLDTKADAVDFGDRFITGNTDRFAGGTTDGVGTSKTAVDDASARGAREHATSPPVVTPSRDRSRPARLAGSAQWRCPFPMEADDAGVDHALVTLRLDIGADGAVRAVNVLAGAGDGFDREARRCARNNPWLPALDRSGQPIPSSVTVNVRFDR